MRLFAGMFATLTIAVAVVSISLLPKATSAQTAVNAPAPRARHHETPKVEVFLGYSRFGTGSNNTVTGNRMVGLNGGSASIAFNFNRYLGIVGDFGGYDDSQVQLTGSGVNQPLVVNSSGTAYTYLFGPRLSFRNTSCFTPFAQVLAGGVYASSVTVNNCAGSGCAVLPVQSSFAFTGGGGLDIRLTRHISIRAVQAEYMLTRFQGVANGVSTGSGASQNDLRLSTASASLSTSGASPGIITVTCNVVDDLGKTATASTSVSVSAPPPPAAPRESSLCRISFERDRKCPVRVDNEAKACLDDIALQFQRESAGKLVIVGNYGDGETPKMAAERAINERRYLTEEKGMDAGRIEPRVGSASGRTATNTFVPAGATYNPGASTAIPRP